MTAIQIACIVLDMTTNQPTTTANDYVQLNALSAVYRVAEIRGGRDGARRDRGWFNIEGLIRIADSARGE